MSSHQHEVSLFAPLVIMIRHIHRVNKGGATSLLGGLRTAVTIVMAYSVEGRRIRSRLTKISREGKQRDVSLSTIRKHANDVGKCIGKLEELATELAEKYLQEPGGHDQ